MPASLTEKYRYLLFTRLKTKHVSLKRIISLCPRKYSITSSFERNLLGRYRLIDCYLEAWRRPIRESDSLHSSAHHMLIENKDYLIFAK